MSKGPNVDITPEDPYDWKELEDDSFDFVISGNAFEHIEYPWLTIKEIYKKLRNGGFSCILAPNTMIEHRYPVDCYRYFSDGFAALAKWANFQVVNVTVSGIPDENTPGDWYGEGTNDTMMILTKNPENVDVTKYPRLNYERRTRCANEWAWRYFFAYNWIVIDNKEERFRLFFNERGINDVYLYGYGDIGKLIYQELKKLHQISVHVIDQKGGKIDSDSDSIIKPGEHIVENDGTCMVIAVLDTGIEESLREMYKSIKMYLPNDILGY